MNAFWLDDYPGIAFLMKGVGLRGEETICSALVPGYPDTEDGLPKRKPLYFCGPDIFTDCNIFVFLPSVIIEG